MAEQEIREVMKDLDALELTMKSLQVQAAKEAPNYSREVLDEIVDSHSVLRHWSREYGPATKVGKRARELREKLDAIMGTVV